MIFRIVDDQLRGEVRPSRVTSNENRSAATGSRLVFIGTQLAYMEPHRDDLGGIAKMPELGEERCRHGASREAMARREPAHI